MKLIDLQKIAGEAASFFHHCVIGGGAPRDAYLGAPIKDIDLFVDSRDLTPEAFDKRATNLIRSLGGRGVPCEAPSVDGIVSYDIHVTGLPVIQLLSIGRCAFTDVHDYDFGLSQILMTPKGLLHTPAFDCDVENRTITYTAAFASSQVRKRSAARLQRLRSKYPEYTPVGCGILETSTC